MSEPIELIAGTALSEDEKLRQRALDIIDRSLDEAEYILQFGAPSDKASLIKSAVPAMMKSLHDEQADEREKVQREAYERMIAAMKGEAPVEVHPKKKAPAKKRAARKKKAAAKK